MKAKARKLPKKAMVAPKHLSRRGSKNIQPVLSHGSPAAAFITSTPRKKQRPALASPVKSTIPGGNLQHFFPPVSKVSEERNGPASLADDHISRPSRSSTPGHQDHQGKDTIFSPSYSCHKSMQHDEVSTSETSDPLKISGSHHISSGGAAPENSTATSPKNSASFLCSHEKFDSVLMALEGSPTLSTNIDKRSRNQENVQVLFQAPGSFSEQGPPETTPEESSAKSQGAQVLSQTPGAATDGRKVLWPIQSPGGITPDDRQDSAPERIPEEAPEASPEGTSNLLPDWSLKATPGGIPGESSILPGGLCGRSDSLGQHLKTPEHPLVSQVEELGVEVCIVRGEGQGDSMDAAVSSLHCAEEVEELEEEGLDGEEFDPFLFIKRLPRLAEVVPAMRPVLLPKQTRRCPAVTLVLDLDETLVHSCLEPCPDADFSFNVHFNEVTHTVYVRRRPFLEEFMERVSKLFEIIIFTASQSIYAEQLLNILDPQKRFIRHRVFRDSCVYVEGNYLKDLSILGRDLAKVAIIDNSPQAFGFQVENGIPIDSWYDDKKDKALKLMLPFLESLAKVEDVRPLIAKKFKLKERIASVVDNRPN